MSQLLVKEISFSTGTKKYMKPKKLKIINQEGEKISLKIAFFLNSTVAPIVCLQFRMQTNNKRSLMNLIKKR